MGRAKLKLERLEPGASRNTTYTKRRHGLTKKVSELSILCDIDIMLLTFSPGGRPALFKSENSSIEEIIKKFAQLSPQERAQRKLESLEVLKKAFKNPEHVINLTDPFGPDYHSAEDLSALAELLRARLSDLNYNLSCWTYMDEIESIEQLVHMKESLGKSLLGIWNCKDQIQRQLDLQSNDQKHFEEQQLGIRNTDQFQQGYFPFELDHQLQLFSCIEHHQKQNLVLQKNLYSIQHGDMVCSGAIPFEGYPGIKTEDNRDMETGHEYRLPTNIPFAGHDTAAPMDHINHGQAVYCLQNPGSGHEQDFGTDFSTTEFSDGFLADLCNNGYGNDFLLDLMETENYTVEEYNSGGKYDISEELPKTKDQLSCSFDMTGAQNQEDALRNLNKSHRGHEMQMDFSLEGNELEDLIKFANDYSVSMDQLNAGPRDGFSIDFIKTEEGYGMSTDVNKAGAANGLPVDMKRTEHDHYILSVHSEGRDSTDLPKDRHACYPRGENDRKENMDMQLHHDRAFKHGQEYEEDLDMRIYEECSDLSFSYSHEHYITDKEERMENLDMRLYEEQLDQSSSFPFQPLEHFNMQENDLVSGIDNPSGVYEFSHYLSGQTSGEDSFAEYLCPQLESSSEDDEKQYNEHQEYLGPTGCPLVVH